MRRHLLPVAAAAITTAAALSLDCSKPSPGVASSASADTVDAAAPVDGGDDGGAAVAEGGPATTDGGPVTRLDGAVLYVALDDGTMSAFQEGTWASVGHWTGLNITDGLRGIEASADTGMLFLAHGSTGPDPGPGHLLAWNLYTQSVVYDVAYTHGIDQPAYGGGVLYMPAGEAATTGSTTTSNLYLIDPTTGAETGSQPGSIRPHNTLYRNGHVYSGGMGDRYLRVQGTGAGKIGPAPTGRYGVRPFTLNADESRAYITWSGYRGFSIGDVQAGTLVTSINFGSNTAGKYDGVSHGISLSPDGTELYVVDIVVNQVRVYDSSDAPTLLATINLDVPIYPGTESPCAFTCDKSGWLLHSRDGKYVIVGDSGDIIDTRTRTIVANVAPLQNSRHGFIEVDWKNGTVVGTTTRFGMGY